MSWPPPEVFLDANLLVLLVVGNTGRDRIARHRRTKNFTGEDYDLLVRLLSDTRTLVTPHTLTEASNLLAQHREPERTRLLAALRSLIEQSDEERVGSPAAARNREFLRLGLTDAVLLEAASVDKPLLTADLELSVAASARSDGSAHNFHDYRASS